MVKLPKPDWLSLSAAVNEIIELGVDEEQSKTILHQLMQEAKILTRMRCWHYYHNNLLNIVPNDQLYCMWAEIPIECFDFHKNIVRLLTDDHSRIRHQAIISDIGINRASLLECFESPAPTVQALEVNSVVQPKKRPGPAFKQTDDLMWAEMARRAYSAEWDDRTTQAKATEQMLLWLQDNEIQLSESTVRNRVRALWSALSWREMG